MFSLTTIFSWILGVGFGLILTAFLLAFFVHVFLTALRFFEEGDFLGGMVEDILQECKKLRGKTKDLSSLFKLHHYPPSVGIV